MWDCRNLENVAFAELLVTGTWLSRFCPASHSCSNTGHGTRQDESDDLAKQEQVLFWSQEARKRCIAKILAGEEDGELITMTQEITD